MAQPRVFVSSTCYDLQEIRTQLRSFIEDFGFQPVMSEFGDIFYDYQKHIQESCKDEIEKAQLFILIIGNNYGSIYYKHKESTKAPDSVTLQEFRKSIETDIYKHIFVNKYIDYDYKNYLKALNKFITKSLEEKEFDETDLDKVVEGLRNDFNVSYPFPQESYKFIFNFLEVVYGLKTNNAIITYESFDDIKTSIRKQWAGFMYDSITKSKTVSISIVEKIIDKIENVENQIKLLTEGTLDKEQGLSKITIDISKLTKDLNLKEFTKIKNEIHKRLDEILIGENQYGDEHARIEFTTEITPVIVRSWIGSLEKTVKKYKWAKTISVTDVFEVKEIDFKYYAKYKDIPFETVFNTFSLLNNAKENISDEDFEGLIEEIANIFNNCYNPDSFTTEDVVSRDDMPF